MLLYEDITQKIIASCFEIINELGSGFLESIYEKALLILLREKGFHVQNQVPLKVYFRDQIVGEFFADLLVEEKVILEIKAAKSLTPEHQAQIINYLKATGIKVGLLVNFGRQKFEFKRFYNEKIKPEI